MNGTARLQSILTALPVTPKTLIELGCGEWEIGTILQNIFPGTRLFGADVRPLDEYQAGFVHADINALPFGCTFDLVLIRHPDVHRSGAVWQACMSGIARWITPGGALLITTYSAPEAELIRAWLPGSLRPIPIDPARLAAVNRIGQDRYFFALMRS
jgi:SAM-dependent methyltransferase